MAEPTQQVASSQVAADLIRAIDQALAYTAEKRSNKPMRFMERLHSHGFTIVPLEPKKGKQR